MTELMGEQDNGRSPRKPGVDGQSLPSIVRLVTLGVLSWICYLVIGLSSHSLHETGPHRNTLLGLLALFGIAFGLYVLSLRSAIALPDNRKLLIVIWSGAVVLRLTLLVSDPIEEVDLYRYVWDGAVSTSGVSPFRYAPQQILAASEQDTLPEDLSRLVRLKDESPELEKILRRVHFGELPTIYPPVSQVVFAICSWLTPHHSSVVTRLTLMKGWFVAIDFVTVCLVLRLLELTKRHQGWAIAYAWCPLVIKEIANSGHLDALAICLTTLSLVWLLRAVHHPADMSSRLRYSVATAVVLALAVGSKLYPVVLAPLLFWTLAKRVSLKIGLLFAIVFASITLVVLWPMVPSRQFGKTDSFQQSSVQSRAGDRPPLPPSEVSTSARDPSESLRAFLGRWEMNDFLFLLVIENLRPRENVPAEQRAWFTFVPDSWRQSIVAKIAAVTSVSTERAPFVLARALLTIVFVVIACGLAKWAVTPQCSSSERGVHLLEAAFLTLAWFWLLLPTQNPWYLLWCLPYLPFAHSRAWFALSGLAFIYYVRFWMSASFTAPILGTPYSGATFFDYVVTWFEFLPWLLWLILDFDRTPANQN